MHRKSLNLRPGSYNFSPFIGGNILSQCEIFDKKKNDKIKNKNKDLKPVRRQARHV